MEPLRMSARGTVFRESKSVSPSPASGFSNLFAKSGWIGLVFGAGSM
jgi:hypothetical protein